MHEQLNRSAIIKDLNMETKQFIKFFITKITMNRSGDGAKTKIPVVISPVGPVVLVEVRVS